MIYNNLTGALETILRNFADTYNYPVAWPNISFDPAEDQIYLEAFLIPAPTVSVGVGYEDSQDYKGVYQVNVVYPKARQSDYHITVDDVLRAFRRGTDHCVGGLDVSIEQSWASVTVNKNDAWSFIPVSIRYRAFDDG